MRCPWRAGAFLTGEKRLPAPKQGWRRVQCSWARAAVLPAGPDTVGKQLAGGFTRDTTVRRVNETIVMQLVYPVVLIAPSAQGDCGMNKLSV